MAASTNQNLDDGILRMRSILTSDEQLLNQTTIPDVGRGLHTTRWEIATSRDGHALQEAEANVASVRDENRICKNELHIAKTIQGLQATGPADSTIVSQIFDFVRKDDSLLLQLKETLHDTYHLCLAIREAIIGDLELSIGNAKSAYNAKVLQYETVLKERDSRILQLVHDLMLSEARIENLTEQRDNALIDAKVQGILCEQYRNQNKDSEAQAANRADQAPQQALQTTKNLLPALHQMRARLTEESIAQRRSATPNDSGTPRGSEEPESAEAGLRELKNTEDMLKAAELELHENKQRLLDKVADCLLAEQRSENNEAELIKVKEMHTLLELDLDKKEAENESLRNQVETLSQKLENETSAHRQKQDRVDQLMDDLSKSQNARIAQGSENTTSVVEGERKQAALRMQIQDLEHNNAQQNSKVLEQTTTIQSMNQSKMELQNQCKIASEDNARLQVQLARITKENNDFGSQIEDLKNRLELEEDKVSRILEENGRASRDIASQHAVENAEMRAKLEDLHKESREVREDANRRTSHHKDALAIVRNKSNDMEREVIRLRVERDVLRKQLEAANARHLTSTRNYQDMVGRLAEGERLVDVNALDPVIQTLHSEVENRNQERDEAVEALRRNQAGGETWRNILDLASNSRVPELDTSVLDNVQSWRQLKAGHILESTQKWLNVNKIDNLSWHSTSPGNVALALWLWSVISPDKLQRSDFRWFVECTKSAEDIRPDMLSFIEGSLTILSKLEKPLSEAVISYVLAVVEFLLMNVDQAVHKAKLREVWSKIGPFLQTDVTSQRAMKIWLDNQFENRPKMRGQCLLEVVDKFISFKEWKFFQQDDACWIAGPIDMWLSVSRNDMHMDMDLIAQTISVTIPWAPSKEDHMTVEIPFTTEGCKVIADAFPDLDYDEY